MDLEDTIIWSDSSGSSSGYFDILQLIITYNNTKSKKLREVLLDLIKNEKIIVDMETKEATRRIRAAIDKAKLKQGMKVVR